MAFDPTYRETELTREELEKLEGPVVVEFGANWCGICGGFTPTAAAEFKSYEQIQHIRVEDGPGKRLGRAFRVKLWPTFVFLRDGQVLDQVSRPSAEQLRRGLEQVVDSGE
jgi:thioredoxin 1